MMDVVRKIIRCTQTEAISPGRVWTGARSTDRTDRFCLYAVIIIGNIDNVEMRAANAEKTSLCKNSLKLYVNVIMKLKVWRPQAFLFSCPTTEILLILFRKKPRIFIMG